MSDANTANLSFQRETTWGVVPTPCALTKLRFTKEDLDHDKMTVKSSTIVDDRQTEESAEVGVEAKGSFDFELVVGDHDQFLEAALFGQFADVGGVQTLINGVTRSSFVLEKKLTSAAHVSFVGMTVDQMTLNVTSRQIITGQFTFLGKQGVSAATTIDTSGDLAPVGTGPILTASAHVGNLQVGGSALASVKSLSLTIANNVRPNDAVGSKTMEDQGIGSFSVTGKIDAYFRNRTLLEAFINHSDSSLSFEVQREPAGAVSGDHIGYRFTIPKMKFTKGLPKVPGKDQDVMLPLELDAQKGDAEAARQTGIASGIGDNNAVSIDGKTYTFKTTITTADGCVHVGVTDADSIANLVAAINLDAGAGTKYGSLTTQHPTVTAAAQVGAPTHIVVTAAMAGAAGNSIAVTSALPSMAWAGATLESGLDSYTIKIEKLTKA